MAVIRCDSVFEDNGSAVKEQRLAGELPQLQFGRISAGRLAARIDASIKVKSILEPRPPSFIRLPKDVVGAIGILPAPVNQQSAVMLGQLGFAVPFVNGDVIIPLDDDKTVGVRMIMPGADGLPVISAVEGLAAVPGFDAVGRAAFESHHDAIGIPGTSHGDQSQIGKDAVAWQIRNRRRRYFGLMPQKFQSRFSPQPRFDQPLGPFALPFSVLVEMMIKPLRLANAIQAGQARINGGRMRAAPIMAVAKIGRVSQIRAA